MRQCENLAEARKDKIMTSDVVKNLDGSACEECQLEYYLDNRLC